MEHSHLVEKGKYEELLASNQIKKSLWWNEQLITQFYSLLQLILLEGFGWLGAFFWWSMVMPYVFEDLKA
ncbi:hypothetical protein TUMEXPCC7403_05400 [Tumidithrix helvetica PCC 7403]